MTIPTNPSPNGYISLPVTVDPNQLFTQAIADVMEQIAGWQPSEGHLEVIVLEEAAQMVAIAASVASQVPMAIFMAFGQLVGVNPIEGVAATVAATITMVDDAGYTIPAGIVLAYPLTGDSSVLFAVQSSITIPNGETTGDLTLICLTSGSFPNGLTSGATLQLQQSFAQVESVVTTAIVEGGVDAETVTAYINRLSGELQLLGPRPILPQDFADLATNVPGVFRALAIDGLNPGSKVTDGVTTNASLNIGSATAHFETGQWVGRTVADTLGHVPAGATIASVTSDTVAVLNTGHAATGSGTADHFTFGDLTGQERFVTVAGLDENGDALSGPLNTSMQAYLESLREVNFEVATVFPTYTEIDVTVTCDAVHGADTGTVQAAINAALTNFLDPSTWGGGTFEPPIWEPTAGVVRFLDIANVILGTAGVLYIPSGDLQLCIHGGSLAAVDVTLPGDAPLPEVGTFTIVVNAS